MIRPFEPTDEQAFYEMAEVFHNSNAVEHNTPHEYFELTFRSIMEGDPLIEGYMIEKDGETAGYGLVFVFYSNEFGGLIYTWDEIYVKPEYRGQGLGTAYIHEMEAYHRERSARSRLECEDDNVGATQLYLRLGYKRICYRQMFKFVADETPHDNEFTLLPDGSYRNANGIVRSFRPDEGDLFVSLSRQFYAEALEKGLAEQMPEESFLRKTFDMMVEGSPFVQGYVFELCETEEDHPAEDRPITGYALAFPSFANEAGGSEIRFDETYFLPQYRDKAHFDLAADFLEFRYKEASAHRMQLAEADEVSRAYFAARGYEYLEYYEMLKETDE